MNTKYENVDPDFSPDISIPSSSSHSQPVLTRNQREKSKINVSDDRNKAIQLLQNIVISDEESEEENELTKTLNLSLQEINM